jgi:hypothetical protein
MAAEGKLSPKGLEEAVRDHFASTVIPDLRRATWQAERSINAIATRRAILLAVQFDKADAVGADHRRELRAFLREMSEGERIAAITSNRAFLEAACELPAMLSGLTEQHVAISSAESRSNNIRRRLPIVMKAKKLFGW